MDDTNSQIVGLLTEIRDLLKNQPTASSNGEAPANRYMNDKGVWVWEVPSNQKPSSCRYCQQDIFWVKSKRARTYHVTQMAFVTTKPAQKKNILQNQ